MKQAVGDTNFWKQRIKEAESKGNLRKSVYVSNEILWENICRGHEKLIKKLIKDSEYVLDAGCGYGRMSGLFTHYVGVDFSEDFIIKAGKLYPEKNFIVADLQKLPFNDETFDWALCISIRNMIQDYDSIEKWERIEKELKRVAKKILILEYTDWNSYEII